VETGRPERRGATSQVIKKKEAVDDGRVFPQGKEKIKEWGGSGSRCG